jgi:uncharacterized protein YjiK
MGIINNITLFVYLILLNACNQPAPDKMSKQPEYNLDKPALSLVLPSELREISGIAYLDRDRAVAIQDERAILYFISLKSGEITDSISFGEDGDYEGIAVTDGNIFVLRSDAYLYILTRNTGKEPIVKKINTFLDNRYDCEGITYNPKTKNLLLSCKQNPNLEQDPCREIYSFSTQNEILEKNPVFSIRLSDIKKYLEYNIDQDEHPKLKEHFEHASEDFFYPSDIAVHPISGDIYICSAKEISILMVLSQDGKIKSMQMIPEEILPQTEGISFTPMGDLILCSEGKAKEERLFIFSWQQ